jgi:wyosine [tRNA(Phe)-imidazoG37] synthetase (radical SAM superfamily)
MLHPVCSEHCTYCWMGHSSGEHVTLTEMWFHSCNWLCKLYEK